MAQRIPTVNAGKYSGVLGPINRNNELRITNLSPMVLANICNRLQTNDIISLYNHQRPIFDNVAKTSLRKAAMHRNADHTRIYLEWKNDVFERVVELLDANIINVSIIGRENLISEDIEKIYHLFTVCPRIISLRLRNIEPRLIHPDILQRLPSLIRIDLQNAPIPITLCLYPNIMEFFCCIGAGDCSRCDRLGDVTQPFFLKFLRTNQQINLIFLHFTETECEGTCKKEADSYKKVINAELARYQAQDGIQRKLLTNLP